MAEQEGSFLGTGWGFPPEFHPRSTGARMISDEEDIREALWILLSTKPGERIMHPSYGCGLHQKVFEVITESAVAEIRDVVDRAILFFEPRVELISVDVDSSEARQGLLRIMLDYTIRTINTRSNMVYPFYIIEGTDVAV